MSEPLKPCPFCGSRDYMLTPTDPYFIGIKSECIRCASCGASGPNAHPGINIDCETLWNTRAENSQNNLQKCLDGDR